MTVIIAGRHVEVATKHDLLQMLAPLDKDLDLPVILTGMGPVESAEKMHDKDLKRRVIHIRGVHNSFSQADLDEARGGRGFR